MMGGWTLFALVAITWLLWAAGVLQGNFIAKREGRMNPDSGVSLSPIIPVIPLTFFAAAKITDILLPFWGTWVIGWIHGLLATAFVVGIAWQSLRPPRKRPGA